MPRGGGIRRTRIGGMSGGFRGGGFRGGPATFRSSTIRSSGRPFGRTGAPRTVSRSPSGPYRHTYYRPRRRYYGYWRYPWYRRFWYSPFWAGYHYRSWYYSPAYVGGGIAIFMIMMLIILPIAGVAFFFPFDNADPSGRVNYRSTETIYYNEYWYEYEYIEAGNSITYSMQSSPSVVSFAIWDQPFEDLPTGTRTGNMNETIFNIPNNGYEYWTTFLKAGSSLEYAFNSSVNVDFFIADAYDLYLWNQYDFSTFYKEENDINQSSGTFSITEAQDYYLVWYNEDYSSVDVTYDINYTAVDVIDLSQAEVYNQSITSISQSTFEVPNNGNWYFFIYFDPMDSPEESTEITFDVTYDTGITARDKWISIQPILIVIVVIIGIVIVAAFLARKSQKKAKEKKMGLKTTSPTAQKDIDEEPKAISPYKVKRISENECLRCGAELKPNAKFCHICGGKTEGRKVASKSVMTPVDSKNCTFCGNSIKRDQKFCTYCGTEISQSNTSK